MNTSHALVMFSLTALVACAAPNDQDPVAPEAIEEQMVGVAGDVPASPELAKLRPMVGSWRCDIDWAHIPPLQQGHTSKFDIQIKFDLGGQWLHGRGADFETTNNQPKYSFEEFWGYDEVAKKYVRNFTGSLGEHGHYTTATFEPASTSWTGAVDAAGAQIPVRDTAVMTNYNQRMTWTGELAVGPDQWVRQFVIACQKRR